MVCVWGGYAIYSCKASKAAEQPSACAWDSDSIPVTMHAVAVEDREETNLRAAVEGKYSQRGILALPDRGPSRLDTRQTTKTKCADKPRTTSSSSDSRVASAGTSACSGSEEHTLRPRVPTRCAAACCHNRRRGVRK